MVHTLRRATGWGRRGASRVWHRAIRSELGEGVISAAIAVLIMAFLGVAMWFGFRQTLGSTQTNVNNQVTRIGTDNGSTSGGSGTAQVGGTGVGGSSGGSSGVGGSSTGGTSGAPGSGG